MMDRAWKLPTLQSSLLRNSISCSTVMNTMSPNCNRRVNFVLQTMRLLVLGAMIEGTSAAVFAADQASPLKTAPAPAQPTLTGENLDKAVKLLREKVAEQEKAEMLAAAKSAAGDDQPAPKSPVESASEGKTLYSFRAENVELKTALALFARANNLNIVPDQDVTGEVTVDVHELPLTKML